jgi:hypothetical protein
MVLPALAASIGAIYGVGKAVDNIRYWEDYHKNTGKRSKYPFRSGSMDWMAYSGSSAFYGGKVRNLSKPKKRRFNARRYSRR